MLYEVRSNTKTGLWAVYDIGGKNRKKFRDEYPVFQARFKARDNEQSKRVFEVLTDGY
jgi:hypothetical protein